MAFSGSVPELYLIHTTPQGLERVYIRRTVIADPNSPAVATCNIANGSGSGCLGSLEILKLVAKDNNFDGVVDSWVCHPDFNCSGSSPSNFPTFKKPANADDGWISLFPAEIDVRDVKFFPFPYKDYRLAWKETDPSVNVASSVRLSLRL